MKTHKKILLYEIVSILTGCLGIISLALCLILMIFTEFGLMLDLIWLGITFILIFVWYYTNNKSHKLQTRWDYENRR
jgi:L-asparagine transporter-like permease